MLIRRLAVALILVLAVATALEYWSSRPQTPCWTATHPGQGYVELISAGTELIEEKFPQWYNKDVPLGLDLEDDRNIGYTYEDNEGTIGIKLTQFALNLCRAEDLSAVLLHEYVHASLWRTLEKEIPNETCNNIRHELMANWTVIQAYEELDYSLVTLGKALNLYDEHYIKGFVMCEPSIYKDLPVPRGARTFIPSFCEE